MDHSKSSPRFYPHPQWVNFRSAATGSTSQAPQPNPNAITACQEITTSGNYTIASNIDGPLEQPSGPKSACISIHDTTNVNLDCGNYMVTGVPPIAITNVQNFSVTHCQFQLATQWGWSINIVNSNHGNFSNNVYSRKSTSVGVPAFVNVTNSNYFVFEKNVGQGYYLQTNSSNNTITNNTLTADPLSGIQTTPAMIWSSLGTNNQINNNTLEGNWNHDRANGPTEENGADDGILLDNEIGAVVQNNQISNVFDCGIEWSGTLANATISGNKVNSAYTCGMGGWFYQSTIGSTFSNNVVTESGSLFAIYRVWGMIPAPSAALAKLGVGSAIIFKDNIFTGNIATNTSTSQLIFGQYSVIPVYDSMGYTFSSTHGSDVPPTPSDFITSNNTFTNNQFGNLSEGPFFGAGTFVPGMVIDGGGNACGTHLWAVIYPLVCN